MTLEEAAHGLTFTGDHKEDIVNDCNFITHIISEICADLYAGPPQIDTLLPEIQYPHWDYFHIQHLLSL